MESIMSVVVRTISYDWLWLTHTYEECGHLTVKDGNCFVSNIPWWLCGHASILPSSPPPCKPATLSFLLSIQAVTPRQLHSEQLNLHDRSEKLSTSRVQDPLRTPRPPPIQTDTRLIAPPAKRDILYRAAELLYKLSLKKKKKYWGSLDHKPDTFFLQFLLLWEIYWMK